MPKKALFSSISVYLTQKTLARVFKAYVESDLHPARDPWALVVVDGTRATLEICTVACFSMPDFRASRKRVKRFYF
jgi:hypothetical protein